MRNEPPSIDQPASLAIRRPWLVLITAVVAMLFSGAIGGGVADRLSPGGFDDPSSESARADVLVSTTFGGGAPDLVIVVDGGITQVDDPTLASVGADLTERLSLDPGVQQAISYWSLGSPAPLASTDGTEALVLLRLEGEEPEQIETAKRLLEEYQGTEVADGLATTGVAGPRAVFAEINETVERDLLSAELIALPLTALLLLIIFGSATSAVLPLLIGGFSILGTFLALDVLARFTEISVFALNFTTAIGLGLAIDYALLIVSRFREELALGRPVPDAVAATVATAGRTVLFSGLTVASALTSLLVFRFSFLRSFAWAGFAVIGLAVLGANVVLPAMLRVLGHRVNRFAVRNVDTQAADRGEDGVWHRIAMTVMRRPMPIATVAVLFLLTLAIPFSRVELGLPDDRVLSPGSETREVSDELRTAFANQEQATTPIVLTELDVLTEGGEGRDALAGYATNLSLLAGVARVDAFIGSFADGETLGLVSPLSPTMATADTTYLSLVLTVEPISTQAKALLAEIRSLDGPGDEQLVGGTAAQLTDSVDGLMDRLPLALGLIAIITFVVLFMAFGSVLMPIKAIALNLLSLTGTLGAMVWIYQDGRLEDLLGFTATGTLNVAMPVLMFVIAFGLSMDYEVFLLSRIREEWLATSDPIGSVAMGLERTGRIVTAAAALIAVVFVSFGLTASVRFMSMFGFGMTLAVLVDAFVVRTTLVPAFMRLAGGANWWAPAPLRRFHDRYGFSEGGTRRPPSDAGPTIVLAHPPSIPTDTESSSSLR